MLDKGHFCNNFGHIPKVNLKSRRLILMTVLTDSAQGQIQINLFFLQINLVAGTTLVLKTFFSNSDLSEFF